LISFTQTSHKQSTATVGNTINAAVTWAKSPTGAGTIDGTGFYTSPLGFGLFVGQPILAAGGLQPASWFRGEFLRLLPHHARDTNPANRGPFS
jgi:hypothetical protein